MSRLPAPLIALAWTLLHFVWQGALIGCALALVRRALPRASQELRYACATAALLAMPAAALSTFLLTWATASPVPDAAAAWPLLAAPAQSAPWRPAPPVWMPWLLGAWCLGVGLLAARFAIGWLRLRRLVARDTRPLPEAWRARAARLVERVGLSRSVRILVSVRVDSPVVVGCLRPAILLPLSAMTGLAPGHLEAAILHELVHVRRWDPVLLRIQLLIETLLFYHPIVWWVSRVVGEEREFCCDAEVVGLTGDRVGYARALTALETLRSLPAGPGLAFSGGSLMSRIQRIFDRPVSRAAGAGGPWSLAAIALAFSLLVVAVVAPPQVAGDLTDDVVAWLPESLTRYQEYFVEAGQRHGVDPRLLAIVTVVESGGNPDAVSSWGATGLMQIMPGTGESIASTRGIDDFTVEQLRDPRTNIDFGAWYLAEQMATFRAGKSPDEAIELAASAYNAGPERVHLLLSEGKPLSEESRSYGALVKQLWLERDEPTSETYERLARRSTAR